MASLQELQRIDRELFSELTESPINPAFLHMSTPLIGKYNPMFYLQINGEALWQMRKLSGNPDKVFEALQYNLPQIGYKLSSSSLARVGIAVNSRVGYIVKKIRNISGGNERRAVRSRFFGLKFFSLSETQPEVYFFTYYEYYTLNATGTGVARLKQSS